jgi:hypothetical protein
MTFPGLPPDTIWRNTVWSIDDWSKVPAVTMFSYFGGVSRYSFSLHGQPFRWMRDGVFVKVDRWPKDRQRLSFFAEAGYGSTSGRFDLRVLVNSTEMMHEVIETPGRLYEVHIPVDLIDKTNVIAFVGDPLPGPPLHKREFVNMRARIADIRVTTLDAPAWDRDRLAMFNGNAGVAGVPGPDGGAALGAGWGEVEYSAGRPLHWLTQRPAQIVILDRKPNHAILRLAGAPGPACPLDRTITVASSAGWTRRVIVRDRELVVPLGDPPVDGCEVLLLTASNPVPTLPSFDPRSLVFRLDRLELTR